MVPGILKYSKNPVISNFIAQIIVLNEGWDYYNRSSIPVKAGMLLYVHGDHSKGYDRLQKQFFKTSNMDDLFTILNFYVDWVDLERYMIPLFFLEQGRLGNLSPGRKCNTLKRILMKVLSCCY